MELQYKFNDGGRSKYFKGETGDCVTRAISIATGEDYMTIYDQFFIRNKLYSETKKTKIARQMKSKSNGLSPRNGIYKEIYHKYLLDNGWKYISLVKFGSKERTKLDQLTHLDNIIVSIPRHIMVMQKGVVNDIGDTRYSYWEEKKAIRTVNGYYTK
tara:strand:+ start:1874 stop:2344 length:471 start_codon:yes stop_codon:yes gene_type:complete